jgi:hypothetical protein
MNNEVYLGVAAAFFLLAYAVYNHFIGKRVTVSYDQQLNDVLNNDDHKVKGRFE